MRWVLEGSVTLRIRRISHRSCLWIASQTKEANDKRQNGKTAKRQRTTIYGMPVCYLMAFHKTHSNCHVVSGSSSSCSWSWSWVVALCNWLVGCENIYSTISKSGSYITVGSSISKCQRVGQRKDTHVYKSFSPYTRTAHSAKAKANAGKYANEMSEKCDANFFTLLRKFIEPSRRANTNTNYPGVPKQ